MRKIRVLDNVYDLITINMEDRFKDNVAFRFYDTANDAVTTTLYKDYVQDIRKAVNYFQSTIPEIKGKKICLLTKNSYEYAVNTFGVVAAGAVLVLLNQRKSWDELSYELGLVEPDAILTDGDDYGFNDQLKAAYQEWPFFRTFIDNIEMSIAKTDQRIAKMYLHLGDRQDLSEKVFTEMQLTRKWVLAIVGDEWPLQRRRVLGCAVRVRNPYVDALSIAQVRALREVRMNQDEMAEEKKAEYMSLILSTVTGVSAGLQNTG